jgi:hypothetical protein
MQSRLRIYTYEVRSWHCTSCRLLAVLTVVQIGTVCVSGDQRRALGNKQAASGIRLAALGTMKLLPLVYRRPIHGTDIQSQLYRITITGIEENEVNSS